SASDPAVWIYALRLARDEHPAPIHDGCWWLLSAAKAEHRIEQTDRRSFTLETLDTTFLSEGAQHMYRADRLPMAVGDEVAQCGGLVRVAAVRDGRPYRLEVQLDSALDDPDVALLAWRDGRIERVSPAEVSTGLSIAWSPGPTGVF